MSESLLEERERTETRRKVMMVSHHQSWPVVVWMPLRCVKQPGPAPPPTVTSGNSPDCDTQHTPCIRDIHRACGPELVALQQRHPPL